MPKCNSCPYICYPEYESNYSECMIFGDSEPPEKYWAEEGCKCNKRTLEKLLREKEEALAREYEAMAKWFEEHELGGKAE